MTDPIRPGTFGLVHGTAALDRLIARAERRMAADPDDPVQLADTWATHAFLYVGSRPGSQESIWPEGSIVEARWPRVRIVPARRYDGPDTRWAGRQPLTDLQRDLICRWALRLVHTGYDLVAYGAFALATLRLATLHQLGPLFHNDRLRVCSALIADCDLAAGIAIDKKADCVNLIDPAHLHYAARTLGWLSD